MAGDKLRISTESQKIRKAVAAALDVHRKPVMTYCHRRTVIHVEKENFKELVQKLTSQDYNYKRKTNNAVLDQTNNVSEASSDLSTVVQNPPTEPAPNEVYSALPLMVEDDFVHGPDYVFSSEELEKRISSMKI